MTRLAAIHPRLRPYMRSLLLGLAGIALLASGSPLSSAGQCFAGSDRLCGCSELIERHIISFMDDCSTQATIAACSDNKCVHDGVAEISDIFGLPSGNVEHSVGGSPMCEIPGKWYLNPLCWLLALFMVIISPFVLVYVALIYAIFLLGDLVCFLGRYSVGPATAPT